jgi:hypothetical protein
MINNVISPAKSFFTASQSAEIDPYNSKNKAFSGIALAHASDASFLTIKFQAGDDDNTDEP